jgi:hypothetical protein
MPPAQHRWGVQGELDALTLLTRWTGYFSGAGPASGGHAAHWEGCRVWYGSRHSQCHRPAHWCSTVLSVPLPPASGSAAGRGERCDGLAPYRLISLDGCWYLTGELNGHITVHPLATIHAVTVLNTTFTPRKRLSQLTTQAGFIRALPHFSCIREVLSPGPLRRSRATH